MAGSESSVTHSSWVFARHGIAMESSSRCLESGINLSLGTDTAPQSMIEAMKFAAVVSKIIDRQTQTATAADVFNAAAPG